MKEHIAELRTLERNLYAYNYALGLITYDEATAAPAESAEGRAEAAEVLSRAQFDTLVQPSTDALLDAAAAEADTEQEQAEVRELRINLARIRPIPADEFAAFTRLTQESVSVWGKAKRSNDFSLFAPYLERLVAARRRQASQIAPDRDPYEVLLDQFERGLTIERCDAFFAQLRAAIVPLLKAIADHGTPIRTDFLDQDWPVDGQRALAYKVMSLWGLDPAHCALAESEHPFTNGFNSKDVRITTHYMPRDVLSSLYSVAHEGGHALYELNIDPALNYTVLAGGSTMGLHESQSRLFENMIGRSRGFVHLLWPTLRTLFPAQLSGVSEEDFYRAACRVEPSLIRTEADELTYGLHVLVRYELEKALFHGELAVSELPAAWNAKYKEYLGVDVPDDAHGVLQDIHWSWGEFGYFPSYALGSAYAAQAMASLSAEIDFDAMLAAGDLTPLKTALTNRLWRYGCMKEPAWLTESLCGGAFDPKYYTEYLTKKYSELYSL